MPEKKKVKEITDSQLIKIKPVTDNQKVSFDAFKKDKIFFNMVLLELEKLLLHYTLHLKKF